MRTLTRSFRCPLASSQLTDDDRKPRDSLPFLGNGIVFLQPRQTLFSWFSQREREFGYETYQISVPSLPPGVVINDPANLDYVFKKDALFKKGEFVKRRSWDLFGPSRPPTLWTDSCCSSRSCTVC